MKGKKLNVSSGRANQVRSAVHKKGLTLCDWASGCMSAVGRRFLNEFASDGSALTGWHASAHGPPTLVGTGGSRAFLQKWPRHATKWKSAHV